MASRRMGLKTRGFARFSDQLEVLTSTSQQSAHFGSFNFRKCSEISMEVGVMFAVRSILLSLCLTFICVPPPAQAASRATGVRLPLPRKAKRLFWLLGSFDMLCFRNLTAPTLSTLFTRRQDLNTNMPLPGPSSPASTVSAE